MKTRKCERCGATWINGQHYWSGTGKVGNELDLAGLVCNSVDDPVCINPCKGQEGGQTWAERQARANLLDIQVQHQAQQQQQARG